MELEELKNQWNLLSEQLKKNEIINHEAIKRMIEKRTLSARDRLIGANVIAVFVLTSMLFLFPLAATQVIIRQELLWMFYIVFPLLILYSLWNIHVLYKFNLATRTLLELHRWILSYRNLVYSLSYTGTFYLCFPYSSSLPQSAYGCFRYPDAVCGDDGRIYMLSLCR